MSKKAPEILFVGNCGDFEGGPTNIQDYGPPIYRFVKFSVGNVIFLYPEAISNKYLDRENDMLNLDIWPLS